MWQARYVAERLGDDAAELVVIKTKGDRIQNAAFNQIEGTGFFTKEIEEALLACEIDLAVHSLKDLPTKTADGLILAAVPKRENPADVLVARQDSIDVNMPIGLKQGAVVGTASARRQAQLSHLRPDIKTIPIRGNVGTRINKLSEGFCSAVVLAAAGIARLQLDVTGFTATPIPFDMFLPAPGQGALGLQARAKDERVLSAVLPLNDEKSHICVTAERAFLNEFGGGCHIPLGALALIDDNGMVVLDGLVAAADGSVVFREQTSAADPAEAGRLLANILKAKGAGEVL